MSLLYDLVLLASVVFLVPFFLLRGIRDGRVQLGLRERLAFYHAETLQPLLGKKVIWVHAVSVGEARAAIPLLKALKEAYPGHALLVTSLTETGRAVARQIPEVDASVLFPFDLSWVARRALRRITPSLVLIVETEIWPNFLRMAEKAAIPVVLVNGRISDRSFPRYCRVRFLLTPVLNRFRALCMQTALDAERIRRMGAPAERITVTRNLKFDIKGINLNLDRDRLRTDFRLPVESLIWVAGSTREGEEEIVAGVFRQLVEAGWDLVLVLVPRHPQRCRAVGDILTSHGFSHVLRSALGNLNRSLHRGEILLVDSVGEMLSFYGAADLVFVGGSLVDVGGHNVLEACLLRKPVLFGPHMQNFKEISELLLAAGGGCQVADRDDLYLTVGRLLADSRLRQAIGENGGALLEKNRGATERTLAVIAEVFGG